MRLPVANPELLYTFLARITSGVGRELERVMAVHCSSGRAPEVLPEADQWSQMADAQSGIRTTGVWKQHFSSWADVSDRTCRDAAASHFKGVAAAFAASHRQAREKELAELDDWLVVRAKQITGDPGTVAVQTSFFEQGTSQAAAQATWMPVTDPAERLAKFHIDSSQRHAARSEADGVLRLYNKRADDLKNRMKLLEPEIIQVGLLMIVPEDAHGA